MNTIKLCNPKTYAQSGYRRTNKTAQSPTAAKRSLAKAPAVRRQPHLLVHATLIVTIVFAFVSWGAELIRAQQTAMVLGHVRSTQITVGTGDSLWAIASAHPVEGVSTPELVDWLIDTNDLSGAALALGQSLTVPDASQQRLSCA